MVFSPGGDVHRAAVELRIVGHDAHGVAVDAGEPGDPRATVVGADLEEAALVEYRVEDAPRVVDPTPVARDGRDQRLLAPIRVVVGFDDREALPRRWRAGRKGTA